MCHSCDITIAIIINTYFSPFSIFLNKQATWTSRKKKFIVDIEKRISAVLYAWPLENVRISEGKN